QADLSELTVHSLGLQSGSTGRIQEGIDLVTGSTVTVAAGTYNEQLTIDKSLTLTGDVGDASAGPGAAAPLLDGGGLVGSAIVISPGTSGVTIEGLEITNYRNRDLDTAFTTGGLGSAIEAFSGSTSNITIRDNFLHNLGWNGVLVGNEGQALHDNWSVDNNVITNMGFIGVELTNTQNSSVTGNVITGGSDILGEDSSGNEPADNSDDGILVQTQIHQGAGLTVSNVTVQDNTISGTHDRAGIELLAWDSTGLLTAGLTDIDVLNNSVSDAFRGLYVFTVGSNSLINDISVDGNEFDGNEDGIQFRDFDFTGLGTHGTIDITHNKITNSTGASSGIHIRSADVEVAGISINFNEISGSTSFDINHEGTGTLDASANYWGSADPATVAAKISGPVDFTPLLENGDTAAGTIGFQADLSELTVHSLGLQSGSTGRIQEAIDLVTGSGSTVTVAAGTYNEQLTIDK
ncbi:MAG TPA: hypothetical protein EYO79_01760, partial [Candidatus Marinimicrobia bacterium]|nr:hypothetical protein [Candidatus Neomarinimicrobiota bacterium]